MADPYSQNNTRQDEYSSITSPLRLIHRIATRVREIAPDGFIFGIKLSAADYVEPASHATTDSKHNAQEDRALGHVTELASWGIIDFIEVSGGDYENPGKTQFSLTSTL
jgi:2,4-dienoyl-CoA reductase-like NADH-dependent reductase (Old Yellow Enzyme family)